MSGNRKSWDNSFYGFQRKPYRRKVEKITKCSLPTAVRDISDLIEKGVLIQNEAGGRSTSYPLLPPVEKKSEFSEVVLLFHCSRS